MKKPIQASLLLMLSTLTSANTLYVDNSSNCAGLATCYATIQTAVNNAQTDDEIRVFPGVYVESIDISLMGSALGAAINGNINFITVNESNIPTARTVQISPASGPAFTHLGSFFSGNVEIDGFVVTSIDDDGIDFDLIGGDITISNMTASGNNRDGIDVEVSTGSHTIQISNTITDNNSSSGLNLDGPDGTQVDVINAQANNNIGEGITVTSIVDGDVLAISITDSVTLNNGDVVNDSAGVAVWSEGLLTVNNLVSMANHGPGLAIIDLTNTKVTDSIFESNAIVEDFSGIFLVSAGEFVVARSIFSGNGNAGINVLDTEVVGNELTSFSVNCSNFSGNDAGVYLNTSVVNTADFQIMHNNFTNQTTAAIHASVDNDVIDAGNNWWGDVSGPTHSNNPTGMGDSVSDSIDDQIGGALGTIVYTPFLTESNNIKQYSSDTLFADDFDGNICTQF